MIEKTGDIWGSEADWICITTNGFVKANGCAVMGRGVALQAATKMSYLPYALGSKIKTSGNIVQSLACTFAPEGKKAAHLLSFPVKHNWWEKADPELIRRSCRQLWSLCDEALRSRWEKNLGLVAGPGVLRVALPRPGCGNGGLDWKDVKPILAEILVEDCFEVWEKPQPYLGSRGTEVG